MNSTLMRVLIVTQNYLPEMGALSNRMYPIARSLSKHGHQVFVATGMPNYPQGKVFPEFVGKNTSTTETPDATILRTHYYVTPRNVSQWKQLRSYLSFIPAVFRSGWRAGKIDVVFVTSPPIFPAVAAICLAKARRAKLIFDIRDLWPDEIIACGAGREGSLAVRVVRYIERWIYKSADLVCCTTEPFIETVVGRGVAREKTMLAPNGADISVFRPLSRDNKYAQDLSLSDNFVVMYSGLLGIKHGLKTVLDAANLLKGYTDIRFVLVGSGAEAQSLKSYADNLHLDNVNFAGEKPVDQNPYYLAAAHVCVTSLLPEEYLNKIIPIKIFEYLACGKPVVAAVGGEGARILKASGGGIAVPTGDAQAMAHAILELKSNPDLADLMGRRGYSFVLENYSREVTADLLVKAMLDLVDGKDSTPTITTVTPPAMDTSAVRD